ncbi:MAG: urea amidolyase associated protein UAAP1 [Acidimicrobiales bacterium]
MSSTSTTIAARSHARAQGGLRVEAMPTVPPWTAADLPSGMDPGRVVWEETIAPGNYSAKVLARGTHLRLVDLRGDACANLIVHNAVQPVERLNVADTVKVQWQAYLGGGSVLLSDQGRALMTMVADGSGVHDALCGPSNRAANEARYGSGAVHGAHPNARDFFGVSLAKFGLTRRDIPPGISLFKGTVVEPDGSLRWQGAPTAAGAAVELVAEMDLIVTLANTPHVADPRPEYCCGPLRVTAWSGEPTPPGSDQWQSTPERERAYLNTATWLAGRP